MKIAIRTIGCRANQADSGALERALDPQATRIVAELERAELIVINTCCVTAQAERDCRKAARRALRIAPEARIVLTGCTVSGAPDFAAGIDRKVELRGGGDRAPERLAEWINDLARQRSPGPDLAAVGPNSEPAPAGTRTRALLKIQHGCSHGCAYCIVPRARGPERSTPLDQVLAQVDEHRGRGFNELVLTGVQLGAWGRDLPGALRLARLVAAVADRFAPGRVRLSSIEPWSVDDALLEVIGGHDRVCPHLHVPVQSGDDRILAAMGRGYRASEFVQVVANANRRVGGLALGTDVLCGFPGEDAAAFAATIELLEAIAPAYVHAFPFSPRPGTPACELEHDPPREVAKERVREARKLGARSGTRFRRQQLGDEREVIVERVVDGVAEGRTDNYVLVELSGAQRRAGELLRVRLSAAAGERLRGEPV